jgi:hypothetical protein
MFACGTWVLSYPDTLINKQEMPGRTVILAISELQAIFMVNEYCDIK